MPAPPHPFDLQTGWACFLALFYLALGGALANGNRQIPFLSDMPVMADGPDVYPFVSIIVAGRNEEAEVEKGLKSLLAIDYPRLEVIFVNDRSTDRTGTLVNALAQQDTRLKVLHITELPPEWLGKTHAMWQGAKLAQAHAENGYLLFTDADVVLAPQVLKQAIGHAEKTGLDHVAALPELVMPGFWLRLFANGFPIYFSLYAKPWEAQNPKSKQFIGIGAFNLLRASVYEAIGTHQACRLCLDDDMKLGKLVKSHGFKQQMTSGHGTVQVKWYTSIPAVIDGLTKNAFPGINFNLWMVAWALSFYALNVYLPIVAVFLTDGETQRLYASALLAMGWMGYINARGLRLPIQDALLGGLGFVFTTVIMTLVVSRSTYRTLKDQGVYWRGTFYPLELLKKYQV